MTFELIVYSVASALMVAAALALTITYARWRRAVEDLRWYLDRLYERREQDD